MRLKWLDTIRRLRLVAEGRSWLRFRDFAARVNCRCSRRSETPSVTK